MVPELLENVVKEPRDVAHLLDYGTKMRMLAVSFSRSRAHLVPRAARRAVGPLPDA